MTKESISKPLRVIGQDRAELALRKLGRAFLALARQQLQRKTIEGASDDAADRETGTGRKGGPEAGS